MFLNTYSNLCHFLSCLRYTILLGRTQVYANTALWGQSCHGAEQLSLQGANGPPRSMLGAGPQYSSLQS